jgi:hypothetical protein
MSDNDFGFELEPFEDDTQHGLSGTVGAYGFVRISYAKPASWKSGDVFRTELVGEHLPPASVSGTGMGGEPHLGRKAVLTVGGVTAEIVANSLGVSRASRALRIRLGGREYTYARTGRSGGLELRRGEDRVTLTDGEPVGGAGSRRRRKGAVRGGVDATDLAVALVLEETGTSSLSVGGALMSAPFRALMNPGDGGGE